MRRRAAIRPGWIRGSLAVATAGALVSLLPLGCQSASAARSNHVPAATLLHEACSATLAASAFRAHGHVTTGGKTMILDVYWGTNGDLITLTQNGDQVLKAIINGPSTYFEGNKTWWQSVTNSGASASLLADRWIDMTADKKDAASLTQSVNKTQILQQCGQGRSTSYAGNGSVNGVKVSKVHQDASKESNTYYIENGRNPYILRVSGNPSSKTSGDLVFSDFDVQPNTTAPAGAIPISQFEQ